MRHIALIFKRSILTITIIFPTTLLSQSYVQGPVSGRWTIDNSPYIVTANISVAKNDSLIIDPGVVVKFDAGTRLDVLRENQFLFVDGTIDNRVIFSSNSESPSGGDWNGIYLSGTEERVHFKHCIIEYATTALDCSARSSGCDAYNNYTTIDSCIIRYNLNHGIICRGSGPSLVGCSLPKTGHSSPSIRYCEIYENGGSGLYLKANEGYMGHGSVEAQLYYNLIRNNSENGIECTGDDPVNPKVINNTIFENNNSGIKFGDNFNESSFLIINNIIAENDIGLNSTSNMLPTYIYNNVWHNVENYAGIIKAEKDVSLDPQFENTSENDFRLSDTSPCIDAGDPDRMDPDRSRSDIGAFYYVHPLSAAFSCDTTAGNVPLTVHFTDRSTGEISNWFWEFGDDMTSTEQNPTHTYSKTGTYTVLLTIWNEGGTDTSTFQDILSVESPRNLLDDYRVVPMLRSLDLLSGETMEILGPDSFWKLSSTVDLPFDFKYLGQIYDQIKISSGGFLTFNVSSTNHYSSYELDDINPKNALAPFWDDLKVSSEGKVHCKVLGESPDRVFIVEFYHMVWGLFDTPIIDFQILLFEGTDDIEFHYGKMGSPGLGADGASIGIKDDQGNFINALDGSRDTPQTNIMEPPRYNYRFTYSPPPPNDIGISDILVNQDCFMNVPDTIMVIIHNYGSKEQTGFAVNYRIGEGEPVKEIVNENLLPGGEYTLCFNQEWVPQSAGFQTVYAWTELEGDANLYNDSLEIENAITVYDIELPAPVSLKATTVENNSIRISWEPGAFSRPLPGIWNGTTSEDQRVHMLLNYNGSAVDSCEIYYTISGDPFTYPKQLHSTQPIVNNEFSFYYKDTHDKMNTDVYGAFIPPDSCSGTWRGAVYVNEVYTIFSGIWHATSDFEAPLLTGYKIFVDMNPITEPSEDKLLTETGPEVTSYLHSPANPDATYYYSIIAKYDDGLSAQSTVSSATTSGENLSFENALKIYPNPARDIISVQLETEELCFIDITALNGEPLYSAELSDPIMHINLSSFEKGVYFITIRSKDFVTTRKIVKL